MNLAAIPKPRQRRKRGGARPGAESKAAIYLRVSTTAQVEESGSLDSQEAASRALCQARGWTVAEVFSDPGQSGGHLDRPGLTALRSAVREGEVSAVVVYSLDRLSRSQKETLILLDEFAEGGAGLAAASQTFDTVSPTGRAMLGMLSVFAELQRAEIRERTKQALHAKAAAGEAVGRTPFGLRRNGPGFEVHPDEWPVVARILAERSAGRTCQRIADGLNGDGVPTATGFRRERRGQITQAGSWHAAAVARICRNPHIHRAAALTSAR